MTRKLQALRLTLDNGEQVVFFGPPTFTDLEERPPGIDSIAVSNQFEFEYEDRLSADDLWLLVQASSRTH